jgi:hypothetical protein
MKQENLITRADGSQVKIVATLFESISGEKHIDNYVLQRKDAASQWSVCSNTPAPGYLEMSIHEYEKRGRSEMLQMVSPGEILTVNQKLLEQAA